MPVGEGGDVVGFAGHGRLGFGSEVSAKSRNRIHAARIAAQRKALSRLSFMAGLKPCPSTNEKGASRPSFSSLCRSFL